MFVCVILIFVYKHLHPRIHVCVLRMRALLSYVYGRHAVNASLKHVKKQTSCEFNLFCKETKKLMKILFLR